MTNNQQDTCVDDDHLVRTVTVKSELDHPDGPSIDVKFRVSEHHGIIENIQLWDTSEALAVRVKPSQLRLIIDYLERRKLDSKLL